ncbi:MULTISPECIES: ankyrin repeat domain-containing protein [unclassified Dyella]|uniref:ankyrin repeat domain-containing protein n=1 Tax=unclassified Dyella TaxID=2634549 RepID=UPI000C84613F|nr:MULTISPECIES: ankyrin repeat domain-containing protein [unclassified Dyella]MDR3443807.1 ankyrin repeat domain-containing protein [Dyella sp.]PMQ03055.1 hypothetical protein DyAD56_20245 [Dyella sp. AD56]
MNATEIAEIQAKYRDLTNYADEDPTAPIDPLTYVASGGDRLLHIAAFRGDTRTMGLLLDNEQELDMLGEMGLTALHYAYWGEHQDAVELLISRGRTSVFETLSGDFLSNFVDEIGASLRIFSRLDHVRFRPEADSSWAATGSLRVGEGI